MAILSVLKTEWVNEWSEKQERKETPKTGRDNRNVMKGPNDDNSGSYSDGDGEQSTITAATTTAEQPKKLVTNSRNKTHSPSSSFSFSYLCFLAPWLRSMSDDE